MQFSYKARTPDGEARAGVVESRSLDAAIEVLQRANLIVVEIKPAKDDAIFFISKLFDRVKQRDLVIFSRQLSTLFQAQVPILHSLRTLASETESGALKKVITAVLDDVAGGAALSQAMSHHPAVFSRFYISLVRAGEESGKLDGVFLYLADYLERSYALTSKARNAMMYPAFVLFAFIVVIIVMLVAVIPKLTSIFDELGQEVPFYTKLVINTSYVLQHYGIFLLLLLLVGAVFAWRWIKTSPGELFFDELKLHIPIIGSLLKKIYLTRLADNLATLVSAGIPIIRGLEITGEVVANRIYERIIDDAAESVKAGNTISASFSKYKEIPPLVTQMIRIGEESGRLEFILRNAAGFYQRDVDNLLENFVSLIEPLLIVFLGLGVGVLVAAVLIPLYNIAGSI